MEELRERINNLYGALLLSAIKIKELEEEKKKRNGSKR
jgi:hypothetical protein